MCKNNRSADLSRGRGGDHCKSISVRRPGIEPGSLPWQGSILPLDHRRSWAMMPRFVRWRPTRNTNTSTYLYIHINTITLVNSETSHMKYTYATGSTNKADKRVVERRAYQDKARNQESKAPDFGFNRIGLPVSVRRRKTVLVDAK